MLTAIVAYAVYFDYKRRNDPGFRKQLKRESKRQARIQKEAAAEQGKQQKEGIKAAVREALEEGFPADLEEREAYFMQQIAQGEQLAGEGIFVYCSPTPTSPTPTSPLTSGRHRSYRRSAMLLQRPQGLA
jgi:MAS20 protein import receptor